MDEAEEVNEAKESRHKKQRLPVMRTGWCGEFMQGGIHSFQAEAERERREAVRQAYLQQLREQHEQFTQAVQEEFTHVLNQLRH